MIPGRLPVLALVLAIVLGACSSAHTAAAHTAAGPPTTTAPTGTAPTTTAPTTTAPATTSTTAAPTTGVPTTPAPTTGVPTTPANVVFSHHISPVTAADLPSTYRAGCPVGPAALRMLTLGYWGFDGRPHVGTIVVNAVVTDQVVGVFAGLFTARFPIRAMKPVDAFGGSDPASMAADNTSGFNCRNAVATGPPRWSVHAYGEAIDVNPVENPYLEGGTVQPPAGVAFTDRGRARPGMSGPGTALNRAFASAGWLWGGRWAGSPDYQHFSKTGG